MKKIGMDDYERVLDSYPFELSGGMNQRVGICTAMIMHPNLLLAENYQCTGCDSTETGGRGTSADAKGISHSDDSGDT